jgi:hypothetical protein
MSPADDTDDRPLANGWEKLRALLEEKNVFNSIEMEMLRLVFLFGARHALTSLSRTPLPTTFTTAPFASEIRAFDREITHVDQQR